MSPDDKDNKKPEDKKPPAPKQVVVTHYGKKKRDADVPPEIIPTEPTHILSSPVETGDEQVLEAQPYASDEKLSQAVQPKVTAESTQRSSQYNPPPNDFDNANNDEDQPGKGGGKGALFFSLISFIAVIVLSYYAYTNAQQLTELQQSTNDAQSSVVALKTQTQKTVEQLETLHDKNISEQTALDNLKKLMESENFRLATLSGNTDWILAQANYLVYMANERLKTAHDITSAVAGLSAADERLNSLANPAFLWVRDVLAKDIAKLKSFPTVNRTEIWEQLGLIADQFNDLQIKSLNKEPPLKESPSPDKTTTSSWKKGLWRSWQELKSLIRVTPVKENPLPLALSAQEEGQIHRVLQMLIEQAKWALLQGENKIYQKSLQTIQSLMSEFFLNNKVQQDLLDQLQHLAQQNVTITLPDISASVQALSKVMIEVSKKEVSNPPREKQ